MLNLTFPKYEFRLKEVNQKKFIFDEIRKKYIQLTPEEWVRQNCIKFLISKKKYNKDLISDEIETRNDGGLLINPETHTKTSNLSLETTLSNLAFGFKNIL